MTSSLEHLRPWMPWVAGYSRASTAQYLARCHDGWDRRDDFEYAITSRGDRILGSAGLMARIRAGGLEIGYWVHAAYTRRGVASQAVALLAEAALGLSWVTHVEIHHDQANAASGGVPRKLGFQFVSTIERRPIAPAETGRELQWRLLADDFPASPAGRLLAAARSAQPQSE